jgi:hypothetical protein
MIVVRIFKENVERFAKVSIVSFESCKRRLKLYFSNLDRVREKIIAGEIIDTPILTLQRDRRIKREKVEIERRSK